MKRFAHLAVMAWICVGCRDLGYPAAGSSSSPPTVRVLAPGGGTSALTTFVSLDVESPFGISRAWLQCGTAVVYQWNEAPFEGNVDLRPCLPLASAGDAGNPRTVGLSAFAIANNGAETFESFSIQVDVSLASLVLRFAPYATPGRAFAITVDSDLTLREPPSVTVGGRFAPAVDLGDAGVHFAATLSAAPPLGIDAYVADGGAVPFEVLTQTEQPLPITATGTALNGNQTTVNAQALLSRVAWQVRLPGLAAGSSGGAAVANQLQALVRSAALIRPRASHLLDGGVVVPMLTSLSNVGAGLAFFDEQTGTLVPNATPLVALDQQGYVPHALDNEGRLFLSRDAGFGVGMETLVFEPGASTPTTDVTGFFDSNVFFSSTQQLTLNGRLCEEQYIGFCPPLHRLSCVGPRNDTVRFDSKPTNADTTNSASPVAAVSGSSYLGVNSPTSTCSQFSPAPPEWLSETDGGAPLAGTPVTNLAGNGISVAKLLPIGDGTFAASFYFGTAPVQTARIGANGVYQSDYPSLDGGSQLPLLARSDGTLVTMVKGYPNTTVQRHTVTGVSNTTQMPGFFQAYDGYCSGSRLPTEVVTRPDGSFAILTSETCGGWFELVFFGSDLQIRWIYQYPLATNGIELAATAEANTIYLLDSTNNRLTALRP